VRGVAIALSLLAAGALGADQPARAEVIDMGVQQAPDPDRGNFWRDMLWPHKDEVELILVKARQAIANADLGLYADYDPTGTERANFFKQTYGPLKYARKLAPDNVDVLRLLGHVADEHGKTREAIEALTAAYGLLGPDKVTPDIAGRLGVIYLRLGKTDEAIRYLRDAQGAVIPGQPLTAHVLVHLANALASRGQMSEAIDVLANAVPPNLQYYANEIALVSFALAVQYDRDEQRGAAFDILDHMQSTLQGQLASIGLPALATMRFAPAEDRHYYFGLLYEAAGHLSEARAEFALYAAAGNLPYRRRAVEHVKGIDELRKNPPADETQVQVPGVYYPYPPPRRRRPAPPPPTP
jgi:tetratricopeptide (TPR) repeat protein